MRRSRRKGSACFNCHRPLVDGENYCPDCGQENNNKQASTRVLLDDFLKDYIAFDSKLFRSVVPLLTKPGLITKEYLDGKRQRYIPPIRVFVFLSFLYFTISYFTGQGASVGKISFNGEEAINSEQFYKAIKGNFNLMVFFFVPLQALLTMAMFRSEKRKYYVNFFVYTLHLFSFFFLLGIFQSLFFRVLDNVESDVLYNTLEIVVYIGLSVYIVVYSVVSLKRVFDHKQNIFRYVILLLMSLLAFLIVMLVFILLLAWIYSAI